MEQKKIHEEEINFSKKTKTEHSSTNKKLLTLQPELIEELQKYADKWAAGSFSAFVTMMFQIFKKHMGEE